MLVEPAVALQLAVDNPEATLRPSGRIPSSNRRCCRYRVGRSSSKW